MGRVHMSVDDVKTHHVYGKLYCTVNGLGLSKSLKIIINELFIKHHTQEYKPHMNREGPGSTWNHWERYY